MRIAPQPLLHQQRQPVHALAHVRRAAREPDLRTRPETRSCPLQHRDHPRQRRRIDRRRRRSAAGRSPARSRSARRARCLHRARRAPRRRRSAPGAKLGRLVRPERPSRNCRRHVVSSDREIPCRRAVAETSRRPAKLSSTIRSLSVSLHCRRRAASAADRTSISSPDLRSTIRSHLSPSSKASQAALGGGLHFSSPLRHPTAAHDSTPMQDPRQVSA